MAAACFRLGLVGAQITQAFAERVERVGLTHKQVGLLAVVDAGLARSQREIATRLHVAPSLVVSLLDQLIDLGAVTRARSPADRRVQVLALTDHGRRLLADSARVAAALDDELRAGLTVEGRRALDFLVGDLGSLGWPMSAPGGVGH